MPNNKPTITELRMTCGACPSQWEGRTADGRHVYIRFRWGELTAGISDSLDEAIGHDVYAENLSDAFDGTMSTEEMQRNLRDVFEFTETPNAD